MTIGRKIIDLIGEENIAKATHCATRLRFEVKNAQSIQDAEIKKLPDVKGTMFLNNQYQIFIGLDKNKTVFEEINQIVNGNG